MRTVAKLSPMMLLPVAVFAGFAGLAGWALMRDFSEEGLREEGVGTAP